jgi:hypothetical protein
MNITLGKLEKVEIRKVWAKEDAHFTPWLAQEDNIALLSQEINIEIEIVGQEESVGSFRADILAKDVATDRYIIIENQYGKTDHSHLGQIITYASGLEATTVIWISERFTEEHRSALDWLNGITDESINFFGVEIELFRIGDSMPAPMFHVVSKPNEWSKTVKRKSAEVGLTDTKLLQQEYWQTFKNFVETKKANFKLQKPLPQHWTNISIGRSGFKICGLINTRDKWIGVQLVVYGDNSLNDFNTLRELYEDDSKINLNSQLEWAEKGGKEHHVNFIISNTNPLDKPDWEKQHADLLLWIRDFTSYFRDKIKNL